MNERRGDNDWPSLIRWYDVTLATPAENLALDEVLLQEVDLNPTYGVLRTWEPAVHFVVVGRSNQIESEVHSVHCRRENVPILRRSSGGGAVVVGPGCLAYALMLPLTSHHRTQGVVGLTQEIMEVIANGLCNTVPGVTVCGTSDLVIHNCKFSGNSQRWLKNAFLHHGTILYEYELPRIECWLKSPSLEPDYRSKRSHGDFLTNIGIRREDLICELVAAWNGKLAELPAETLNRTQVVAAQKYESDAWTFER